MNLTLTELIEPLALASMAVYVWNTPIRRQAMWSIFGFALFLAICHYALGLWGDKPQAIVLAGVAAHIFAFCHIKFNYDKYGLFIGLCFVAIGLIGGLAGLGMIPIITDQGAGADAWTSVSALLYLSWVAFIGGARNARKSRDILVN